MLTALALLAAVREFPGAPAAWSWLARVGAWQEKWDEAERILDEAVRAGIGGGWIAAMRARVRDGARASTLPAGSPARALALVDVFLGLDAAGAARRVLEPELARRPTDYALVEMMVVVEALDGRYDVARDVLAEARRHDPAGAARWDAARRELEESERLYGGRRRVPTTP